MSIWISAWCTRPLGQLTVNDMLDAAAQFNYATLADLWSLPDDEGAAAGAALRFEDPSGDFGSVQMYCRPDNPDAFIQIERAQGDAARMAAGERLYGSSTPPGSNWARDILSRTVDLVTFDLKQDDEAGMGGVIAWYLAMWLGVRGDGAVSYNEEWWDPRTHQQVGDG